MHSPLRLSQPAPCAAQADGGGCTSGRLAQRRHGWGRKLGIRRLGLSIIWALKYPEILFHLVEHALFQEVEPPAAPPAVFSESVPQPQYILPCLKAIFYPCIQGGFTTCAPVGWWPFRCCSCWLQGKRLASQVWCMPWARVGRNCGRGAGPTLSRAVYRGISRRRLHFPPTAPSPHRWAGPKPDHCCAPRKRAFCSPGPPGGANAGHMVQRILPDTCVG